MGSVQINSDGAGGQKAARAYTIATGSHYSVYCRVKFPTIASTWACAHEISNGSSQCGLYLDGGGGNVVWDNSGSGTTVVTGASAGAWYDFAIIKNASTVDIYYKVSTTSSWSGPVSATLPSFTPATITLGDYPDASSLCNKPTRYGKIVVWSTTQSAGVVQAEATARALQASSNVWFYDSCSSAATFGTDGSGSGNNFTITGTPADNADDPFPFPATYRAPSILRARREYTDDAEDVSAAGWFDAGLELTRWFDEELDPPAELGVGDYPFYFQPFVRRVEMRRRATPWEHPLAAFVPLGARPIDAPQPYVRAKAVVVRTVETAPPLSAFTPVLGAQPVDSYPAGRLASRPMARPPLGDVPLAGVLGVVPGAEPAPRATLQRVVRRTPDTESTIAMAPTLGAFPLGDLPAVPRSRPLVLLPATEGLAAHLGIVPLGEAPALVRPRRSPVLQSQDVPLGGLLGLVPAPAAQAFAMRQALRLPATDAGPPPALFLFAPWIADDFPPRTTRITRARPPPDGQALSSLTATTLGVLIESLPARPSRRARGPVVPADGQPPLAPFVVSLGAWLDPGAPAPRAMARSSVPRLTFDAPLLGPWGWAPSDATPVVRARRIVQPPVTGHPLGGLISSWVGALAERPPLVATRARVPAVLDPSPPLPALETPALLPWLDEPPRIVLVTRLRIAVVFEGAPAVLFAPAIYAPAPSHRRGTLRTHPRHGALEPHPRSGQLRSHNRRGTLR
jgi:hypothetical protein